MTIGKEVSVNVVVCCELDIATAYPQLLALPALLYYLKYILATQKVSIVHSN